MEVDKDDRFDLTGKIMRRGLAPDFMGSYSLVYRGEWDAKPVAIKVIKSVGALSTMRRKVRRERMIWATLEHPNILPFYGHADDGEFAPFGAFISPWCSNGDVGRFLEQYGAEMKEAERIDLWEGVLRGVSFLHSRKPLIIHGDLKPGNILIDDNGNPRICDFGLSCIIQEGGPSGMTTTTEHTGTERYLAPELATSAVPVPTTKSDVYALGCLGLEFIYSERPYAYRQNNRHGWIIFDIKEGIPPATRREDVHLPRDIQWGNVSSWEIIEALWSADPARRPDASYVVSLIAPKNMEIDHTPSTGGTARESYDSRVDGSDQSSSYQERRASAAEGVWIPQETETARFIPEVVVTDPSAFTTPKTFLPKAFEQIKNLVSSTVFGYPQVSGPSEAMSAIDVIVSTPPPLFALIIGIGKYKSNDLPPLKGAVADAQDIKAYLETSLGVPASQIRTLYNEEATRDAIIESLRDLATNNRINRGDPILIYYAGRGGTSKAPDGLEPGDVDIQVLFSHDSIRDSENKRVFGIPGRTIGVRLEHIAREKDDNITVILDCSHSGSMTGRAHARRSHVLLSACGADEDAKETQGRGCFTKHLLDTLQVVGVDKVTYANLVRRIRLPRQNPQCEGFNQDRICFSAKAPVRTSRMLPVRKVDQEYIIEVGTIHGISDGAIFAIYNDRAVVSTQPPVAKMAASKPNVFSTNSIPLPDTREFDISEGGFALLIRPGKEEHLRIHIGMDKKLQRIFQEISDEPQIDDPEQSTFMLVEKETADLSVAFDGDHVVFNILDPLVTAHGLNRLLFSLPPSPTAINSVINKAARYFWHLRRTSSSMMLQGTVSMEITKLEELEECDEDLCPTRRPCTPNLINNGVVDIVFEEDAIYGIKLTNKLDKPLDTSLFYFDNSDLSITSYFEPGTSSGKVDPSLRPYGSLAIGYGSGGVPPFGFSLREGKDVGVGFLKLFISTEPGNPSTSLRVPQSGKGSHWFRQSKPIGAWSTLLITVVQRRGPST